MTQFSFFSILFLGLYPIFCITLFPHMISIETFEQLVALIEMASFHIFFMFHFFLIFQKENQMLKSRIMLIFWLGLLFFYLCFQFSSYCHRFLNHETTLLKLIFPKDGFFLNLLNLIWSFIQFLGLIQIYQFFHLLAHQSFQVHSSTYFELSLIKYHSQAIDTQALILAILIFQPIPCT